MRSIDYSYSRTRLLSGFDGNMCKIYPQVMYDRKDTAFLFYTMLLLSGSDVFYDSYVCKSIDGGQSFMPGKKLTRAEKQDNGIRTLSTPITVYYNRYHKVWLVLKHQTSYTDDRHPVEIDGISTGGAVLSIFDPMVCDYMPVETAVPFPFPYITAVPHSQIIEYENGDMLISFYFTTPDETKSGVIAIRYALDDNKLRIVHAGEPLIGRNYTRGFCEPSIAALHGKYYMTIRTDEVGLFSCSDDGYHFSEPQPWVWDDGSVLENYNTMQRWIRHPDGLFLAYTRRGAHNDHVFRNRAPIFMTRFDEERKCLIRDEEVILVPELGARLGNFTVTDASSQESWLFTAEWMQPSGCEKYGSDNSIWHIRIKWNN